MSVPALTLADATDHSSACAPQTFSPLPPQALPDLDTLMTSPVRVLESIPRGARRPVGKLLSDLFARCASAGVDDHPWHLLLALPRLLFAKPTQGERVADAVRRRCTWWQAHRFSDLWSEALRSSPAQAPTPEHLPLETSGIPLAAAQDLGAGQLSQGAHAQTKRRAEMLARQGLYRRALASLFATPCVPVSDSSASELEALHPFEEELSSLMSPPILPQTPKFSPSKVRRMLKAFQRGSSAGISLLSARHLNELVCGHSSDALTESLAGFVSCLVRGVVPSGVRKWVFGARLVGIAKRGGGTRPIASGETLRRLAAKLLCSEFKHTARNFFLARGQVGVAVRCGAEGLIRAAQLVTERGDALFKADFKNAFNSVSRTALCHAVAEHFQQLMPYFWAAYGTHSCLVFGSRILASASGVQQGDPLGPLFFSLALAARLEAPIAKLHEEGLVLTLNGWYLDDGTIAGSEAAVARFVDLLLDLGDVGLHLNLSKCELISTLPCTSIPPSVQRRSPTSWELLGTPLGSRSEVEKCIERLLPRIEARLKAVSELEDTRAAYLITRYCLVFGPVVHLLRSFGPSAIWARLDASVRHTCEGFLGDFDDDQWTLATLPLRVGGLGLRQAHPFASIAFAAADRACKGVAEALLAPLLITDNAQLILESCDTLQRFNKSRSSILESLRKVGVKCPSSDAKEQKEWSDILMTELHEHWLARPDLDPLLVARSISAAGPLASAWLTGVGCDEQHLPWISRREFDVLISLRFARPVLPPNSRCKQCGKPSDEFGHHALTCLARGNRTMAHHDVVDAFVYLGSSALLHPLKEQYPFLPPNQRLRVDLAFRHTMRRSTFLDVAITHPFGTPEGRRFITANPPGAWAERFAQNTKVSKYGQPSREVDASFVPLVVDTAGAWCEGARLMFSKLGKRLTRHFRYEPSYCTQLAAAHVSVVLHRGIARLVLLQDGPG